MKPILFVMPVCFMLACKQPPQLPESRRIPLADSLGTITIDLPPDYDTAYSWVHYGEKGKDFVMYRYQPKLAPCEKGPGIGNQLTLYLSIDKIYDTTGSIQQERKRLLSNVDQLVLDTVINISGQQFYVCGRNAQQPDSFYLQTVLASTIRNGRSLTLSFERRTAGADSSFFEKSRNALLAMRLD